MSLFGAMRTPRNLVFGAGQRGALPGYAARLGRRALVVTDARLSEDADFRRLMDGLKAAGVEFSIFDGTIAELPLECIAKGVETGKAFGVDLVIGIGGGSCLDAAKVAALLLAHPGKASDYYGEFKVPGPVLPLILLPTTSGTGSEVTPVAVITDPDRAIKVGIASPHLICHTAICDPELTYSCPPVLTAVSGADALTHAIEAYTTIRRQPTASIVHEHVFLGKNALSDAYALMAISHISASLKRACENGNDREARERLMLGATAAGLAFGTAGTAAAHAVQYPVGAMTHTAHGAGVAVMMPYVMEFNRSYCELELAEIGQAMGLELADKSISERADATIDAVATIFASIGIPKTIADLGIVVAQLPQVAEQAMSSARLIKNNPRPLDLTTMAILVNAAFTGDRARLRANAGARKIN
ncbi:alcohol dehydrogenase [Rhizobium sp. BK529]|uniref:iron-containing alcohol dehydrogenase n=1 Tax=unclassified Rhizobium TaxID=2613769 RepID=UPI0010434B5F|nr:MULTISPECIES: iron-containing alcohol dehydrogenase [unclassified Rhizobium]MBB3593333.1 alcohol dehydrogenase [Rhizobium sp. BK529]TCS03131.1 alcohol dehydrogenase [Rhizobium sp. BK418]